MTKRILSLIIGLSFICQLTVINFQKVDLNLNGDVDLQDAVMAVQKLQKVLDYQEPTHDADYNITDDLGNVISVFQIVSGVKSNIKTDNTKKNITQNPIIAIISTPTFKHFKEATFSKMSENCVIHSNLIKPLIPPPRTHLS